MGRVVGPVEALVVGGIAGVLCQEAVGFIRTKASIDDTLDVFAVRGVGGIFGTVIIAVFGAGTWAAQLGGLAVVGLWTGWGFGRVLSLGCWSRRSHWSPSCGSMPRPSITGLASRSTVGGRMS